MKFLLVYTCDKCNDLLKIQLHTQAHFKIKILRATFVQKNFKSLMRLKRESIPNSYFIEAILLYLIKLGKTVSQRVRITPQTICSIGTQKCLKQGHCRCGDSKGLNNNDKTEKQQQKSSWSPDSTAGYFVIYLFSIIISMFHMPMFKQKSKRYGFNQ